MFERLGEVRVVSRGREDGEGTKSSGGRTIYDQDAPYERRININYLKTQN